MKWENERWSVFAVYYREHNAFAMWVQDKSNTRASLRLTYQMGEAIAEALGVPRKWHT